MLTYREIALKAYERALANARKLYVANVLTREQWEGKRIAIDRAFRIRDWRAYLLGEY